MIPTATTAPAPIAPGLSASRGAWVDFIREITIVDAPSHDVWERA